MDTLIFEYTNAKNEFKRYELSNWKEEGHYIRGYIADDKFRTFRKDRINCYLSSEQALANPYSPPPPKLNSKAAPDDRLKVLFTGFAKNLKAELIDKAEEAGLRVMKARKVTGGLDFLVCGSNAGPKKISEAMQQETYIVSEKQFQVLIKTGELIEEA
jgi:NAD-dependent DNA ligase